MSATAIEWATEVWNPVTGCDRVSPGCAHCYALELAPRLRKMARARGGGVWADAPDGGKASGPAFGVVLHEDRLQDPLRLGARRDGQRRRIFVNSMSDLFHEDVPFTFIGRVLNVIGHAQRHDFLVLTKRPTRMLDVMCRYYKAINMPPLPNLWLGVSIENRRFLERAELLRQTPAAVRFVSAEPLLGPLVQWEPPTPGEAPAWDWSGTLKLFDVDWLIVGGESGRAHRPIREEWVRDLRDACAETGTAFFFKQWGGRTPKAGGRELDGRTWDEIPVARTAVAA